MTEKDLKTVLNPERDLGDDDDSSVDEMQHVIDDAAAAEAARAEASKLAAGLSNITFNVRDQLQTTQPRKNRPQSPTSLSNTTLFKLYTQMSRYKLLTKLFTEVQGINKDEVLLDQIEGKLTYLSEMWEKFLAEHESIGSSCSCTLFNHEYMKTNIFDNAMDIYYQAKTQLEMIKSHVKSKQVTTNQTTLPTCSAYLQSTLPRINIPTFSGDSSSWPSFRDLFCYLVHDRIDLRAVAKLHYLKTSLSGQPAQLLMNAPMMDASYEPAWKQLKDRYDDSELLIFAHISNLSSETQPSAKSPEQLYRLVSTVQQNLVALRALNVPVLEANYFLIYLVANKLDSQLREAWEIKRSSMKKPTTLSSLLTFISRWARALESAQAAAIKHKPLSSAASDNKHQPTHQQTTQIFRHGAQSKKADYPCDLCNSRDHFLGRCKDFEKLSEEERYKVVLSARLCFSCFGHHSIQVCNSKYNCSKCNQRHHTMIHEPRTASLKKRGYKPGEEPQPTQRGNNNPSTSQQSTH